MPPNEMDRDRLRIHVEREVRVGIHAPARHFRHFREAAPHPLVCP